MLRAALPARLLAKVRTSWPFRRLGTMLAAALVAAPVAAQDRVPTPTLDFEGEYLVRESLEDLPSPMNIRQSGGWYRYDVEFPQPQLRTYAFSRDGYAGGIFIFEVGKARLAVRIASLAGDPVYDLWGKRGTHLSDTKMAGEPCGLWRVEPDASDVTTSRRLVVCVAADGVALYVAWEDQPKKPLLRATSVQRRPQDPAWFSMPPGLKLRDVPDMAAYEREIAAWAKGLKSRRPKK
jgi:hypothetical protein